MSDRDPGQQVGSAQTAAPSAQTIETGLPAVSTDQLLRQLFEVIEGAKNLPMSTSVRIERDDVLDMIEAAINQLPDELRAARWLLKERDEVRAKARREADEIIEAASARVAQMVNRSEVVKASEHRAREVTDTADGESRLMMRQAEDYCDQKLASFQVALEKIQRTVASGRQRLAATVEEIEFGRANDEPDETGFFDHEIE